MKKKNIKKMIIIRYIAILMIGQWMIGQEMIDNASNYTSWANNSNQGNGFLPWNLTNSGGDSGHFIGNPSFSGINNGSLGTLAFAMFGHNGQVATSSRKIPNGMNVGDVFSFDWGMNWDGGSSGNKGFDLKANNIVIFNVNNANSATISSTAGIIDSNYGVNVMNVTLTRISNTQYLFSMTKRSDGNTFNHTINSTEKIDELYFYIASQQDNNGNRNLFFNNLKIIKPITVSNGNWNNNSTWINNNVPPVNASVTVEHQVNCNVNTTLQDLIINSNGKVVIESAVDLQVTGSLTNNAGVGGIEIKSDANGTASLRHNTIDIPATVERYIPAKRAWRILAAPHKGNSNNTIEAQWQEQGKDLLLWKPNGGNGFAAGPQSNIYKYTSGWQAVTTNSEQLFDENSNKPLIVFTTGPHGSTNISSGATETTITTTGNLISGNVTLPILSNSFNLIANPYSSALDIAGMIEDNAETKIWLLDPSTGIGVYYTYDGILWTPNTPALEDRNIELGQGFFVRSTGNTFTINANKRVAGSSNNWLIRQQTESNNHEVLRVLLYKNINNNFQLFDGIATVNHEQGNNAIDEADATKLFNFSDNIMFANGNSNLSIEYRNLPLENDVQPIHLTGTTATSYQLRVFIENHTNSGLAPYLEDALTNSLTAIPTDGSALIYPFQGVISSTTNPDNRFKIVYQQPLSISDNIITSVVVHPNPVTSKQLNIRMPQNEPAVYQVSNILGQVIKRGNLTNIENTIDFDINSGVYMLNIIQGDKYYSNKIIVK